MRETEGDESEGERPLFAEHRVINIRLNELVLESVHNLTLVIVETTLQY